LGWLLDSRCRSCGYFLATSSSRNDATLCTAFIEKHADRHPIVLSGAFHWVRVVSIISRGCSIPLALSSCCAVAITAVKVILHLVKIPEAIACRPQRAAQAFGNVEAVSGGRAESGHATGATTRRRRLSSITCAPCLNVMGVPSGLQRKAPLDAGLE
jgi:hypothetical protein